MADRIPPDCRIRDLARALRLAAGGEVGFGLVEALVAAIILAVGLLAVAGLSSSTSGHERLARWQTHQALAGQAALTRAYEQPFDSLRSGITAIVVGGHAYGVSITVTELSPRVKEVSAEVAGVGTLGPRTFLTRVYAPRLMMGWQSGGTGGAGSGAGGDAGGDAGDGGGADTGGDDDAGAGGDPGGDADDDPCTVPNGKRRRNCP